LTDFSLKVICSCPCHRSI